MPTTTRFVASYLTAESCLPATARSAALVSARFSRWRLVVSMPSERARLVFALSRAGGAKPGERLKLREDWSSSLLAKTSKHASPVGVTLGPSRALQWE